MLSFAFCRTPSKVSQVLLMLGTSHLIYAHVADELLMLIVDDVHNSSRTLLQLAATGSAFGVATGQPKTYSSSAVFIPGKDVLLS